MRRLAFWTAGLAFTLLVLAKFDLHSGFTRLIRFGEPWENRRSTRLAGLPIATAAHSNGYDGQFYAQLALDPSLRSPEFDRILDVPGYRARRILLPAIAWVLGAGQPWWILQAYALLNVVCWFLFARLLLRFIEPSDPLALARWIACVFSVGILESVRQSLTDLPALLLLAAAVDASHRARSGRAGCWLALGNLTRETNVLGAVALQVRDLFGPADRKRALLLLAASSLPLAVWLACVRARFPATPAGLGNFNWPFVSAIDAVRQSVDHLAHGDFDGRYSFGLAAIVGLVVQAWTIWKNPRLDSAWWRIGAAYSLLLIFLGGWPWSAYWAVCRVVLPLTIAFNLLLPGGRGFWLRWILGNLALVHGVWRFL